MSVRMRHTRAHTNNRRSHHALDGVQTVVDKDSGKTRLPHRVDEATGMYRGKQIAKPKVEKAPAEKAPKAKLTEAEHAHVHEAEAAQVEKTKGSKGVADKVSEPKADRERSDTSAS